MLSAVFVGTAQAPLPLVSRTTATLGTLAIGAAEPQNAIESTRPRIIIDSPKSGETFPQIATIRFHTENLKLAVPLPGAIQEPRTGYLQVSVDGSSWYWIHASENPVVIARLAPGPHTVRLELAAADHQPLDSQAVTFTIAGSTSGGIR